MARDEYYGLEYKRSNDALRLKRGCSVAYGTGRKMEQAPYGDDISMPTDSEVAKAVWERITAYPLPAPKERKG